MSLHTALNKSGNMVATVIASLSYRTRFSLSMILLCCRRSSISCRRLYASHPVLKDEAEMKKCSDPRVKKICRQLNDRLGDFKSHFSQVESSPSRLYDMYGQYCQQQRRSSTLLDIGGRSHFSWNDGQDKHSLSDCEGWSENVQRCAITPSHGHGHPKAMTAFVRHCGRRFVITIDRRKNVTVMLSGPRTQESFSLDNIGGQRDIFRFSTKLTVKCEPAHDEKVVVGRNDYLCELAEIVLEL
jgi:hypothetical protein